MARSSHYREMEIFIQTSRSIRLIRMVDRHNQSTHSHEHLRKGLDSVCLNELPLVNKLPKRIRLQRMRKYMPKPNWEAKAPYRANEGTKKAVIKSVRTESMVGRIGWAFRYSQTHTHTHAQGRWLCCSSGNLYTVVYTVHIEALI